MKQTIKVSIQNANNVLFEGEATALSSFNEKGPFDVLPFHTHFISIVKNQITVYEPTGKKQQFPIDGGVLRVLDDVVDILLGIEVISV